MKMLNHLIITYSDIGSEQNTNGRKPEDIIFKIKNQFYLLLNISVRSSIIMISYFWRMPCPTLHADDSYAKRVIIISVIMLRRTHYDSAEAQYEWYSPRYLLGVGQNDFSCSSSWQVILNVAFIMSS